MACHELNQAKLHTQNQPKHFFFWGGDKGEKTPRTLKITRPTPLPTQATASFPHSCTHWHPDPWGRGWRGGPCQAQHRVVTLLTSHRKANAVSVAAQTAQSSWDHTAVWPPSSRHPWHCRPRCPTPAFAPYSHSRDTFHTTMPWKTTKSC